MTDVRESFVFLGSALTLAKMETRYEVKDAVLLIESFPRWKVWLAYLFWRTPLRHLLGRWFMSPFATIRAVLILKAPIDDPDARLRRQAAEVIERDNVSRSAHH